MPWDVIELKLQKKISATRLFFFLYIADQRSAMKHLSYPFCVLNPVTGQTFWPFFLRGNLRGCESSTCARVKAAITWPGGQHFTCPPMFPERLSLYTYSRPWISFFSPFFFFLPWQSFGVISNSDLRPDEWRSPEVSNLDEQDRSVSPL